MTPAEEQELQLLAALSAVAASRRRAAAASAGGASPQGESQETQETQGSGQDSAAAAKFETASAGQPRRKQPRRHFLGQQLRGTGVAPGLDSIGTSKEKVTKGVLEQESPAPAAPVVSRHPLCADKLEAFVQLRGGLVQAARQFRSRCGEIPAAALRQSFEAAAASAAVAQHRCPEWGCCSNKQAAQSMRQRAVLASVRRAADGRKSAVPGPALLAAAVGPTEQRCLGHIREASDFQNSNRKFEGQATSQGLRVFLFRGTPSALKGQVSAGLGS